MFRKSSLLQSVYQLWYGTDLMHIQGRRERRALMVGSVGMLVMGCVWGVVFSALGNWPLVVLDVVMVLGAVGTWVLVWFRRVHAAAVLIFSTLLVVICVIAAAFDGGTPQAPRTTHYYLLPLSVAALMVFRTSAVWLRHGVAILCLAAFAVLSVTYGSVLPQYALPEDVRGPGAWVQIVAAIGIFYAMLHVMQNDAVMRSRLETDLRVAHDLRQFELHYQPQHDVSGRVIGAEALIRWRHPQRGLVMPGQFIEIAEQTGMILPIGQWVLAKACEQLHHWSARPELAGLRLAVNISQLQFCQKDFVAQILGAMQRYDVQPGLLELELTESMLAEDLEDVTQKMTAIRARGVAFSLDDFGTGYSSLNYLKRLPLSQLKIDQSFVQDVLIDPSDASIVKTVVALGHSLGLSVIAEGVETAEQRDFLKDCGCDFLQGFLFSQALPAEAFAAYVGAQVKAA